MNGKSPNLTRRAYVGTTSALLAGGLLAGCTSGGTDDGGSDDGESNDDSSNDDGAASATRTTDRTPATSGTPSGDIPALSDDAEAYLSDAQEYSGGEPTDYTGQSEVEVQNGAGARGIAFDPAAVTIGAGTTVVWKWTGRGGEHDVVAVDESFESELVESSTKTFSHTFDEAGEFLYNCSKHEDKGMKGVVVVV